MKIKETQKRVIDSKTLDPYLIKEIDIDDSKSSFSIKMHGKESFDKLNQRLSLCVNSARRERESINFEYRAEPSKYTISFTGNVGATINALASIGGMSNTTKDQCLAVLEPKSAMKPQNLF